MRNLSTPDPRVAVVIPGYRCEATIAEVLHNIPDWVTQIVYVDDCSPDGAIEVIRRLQTQDDRIVIVEHQVNQGVGGAVLSGYKKAYELGAEVMVKMDSDGQMEAQNLPKLIQPIVSGQADYTKGNRFLHFSKISAMPFLRRIGNVGLSFLVKVASGYWNVFDPTNGFTAMHASVYPLLDTYQIDKRFFFESSMLAELGVIRAVVRDVPIPARYGNEKSSLSELDALFNFPFRLAKKFLRRITIQYFIRDFSAFSLFLILGLILSIFGTAWGAAYWLKSIRLGIPATTGTVMIAVLPLIVGIQLIIQSIALDIQNVPQEPIHNQSNSELE
jgi:glycosyltransferase involved in cell wall biosynthesis